MLTYQEIVNEALKVIAAFRKVHGEPTMMFVDHETYCTVLKQQGVGYFDYNCGTFIGIPFYVARPWSTRFAGVFVAVA